MPDRSRFEASGSFHKQSDRKKTSLAALARCNRARAVFGPAHVVRQPRASGLKTVFLRILRPVENCKLPFCRRGFHSELFSLRVAQMRPFLIPGARTQWS